MLSFLITGPLPRVNRAAWMRGQIPGRYGRAGRGPHRKLDKSVGNTLKGTPTLGTPGPNSESEFSVPLGTSHYSVPPSPHPMPHNKGEAGAPTPPCSQPPCAASPRSSSPSGKIRMGSLLLSCTCSVSLEKRKVKGRVSRPRVSSSSKRIYP